MRKISIKRCFEALIMNEESQNLNTSNLSETFEYFVMIKFKLQKDAEIKFYNEVENYLKNFHIKV